MIPREPSTCKSKNVRASDAVGPAALRALTMAFAHLQDFNGFVAGLQAALGKQSVWPRET